MRGARYAPAMHRLTVLVVCAVLACGKSSDSGGAGGSTGSGSGGSGTAAGAAAGSSTSSAPPKQDTPCLVGTWDGKDIVNKIRGATHSLAKGNLMQTGGTITYEFRAPADNKGDVVVHAEKL